MGESTNYKWPFSIAIYVQLPEGIASTSFRLQYPVDHPVRNSNVQPNLVWSGRRCWLHLDSIWFFQVCAEFYKVVLCSNRNPKKMDVILFMRCHNNHEISPGMGNLTPMIAKQLQWTGWLDYRWSVRPRIHSFKKKQDRQSLHLRIFPRIVWKIYGTIYI